MVAPPEPRKMIRACIIGISGYGRAHYELLNAEHAAGNLAIVGATVINQDQEVEACAHLRALGCRMFDDYTMMLRELSGKADLCCIPTGTPLHCPMTIAALEAGMHVLVEKPAAGCMADVESMQKAARQARRIVAVGYQHMYSPVTLAVKRHILDGTIGKLESIKCLVMWPRDHGYYGRNRWAGRLMLDGRAVNDSPFNNAVAHELMMMLFQAGPAEREAAVPIGVRASLYRANDIESCDTASMRIETAEGAAILFYATHACQISVDPEIVIRGRTGTISMTHRRALIKADGSAPVTLETGGGDRSRRAMIAAVLDAVKGGPAFICDLDVASCQTQVVDIVHATSGIRTVKGTSLSLSNGETSTIIPGIEEALRKSAEVEMLLKEIERK
jgi:predicted dehydrogenase